MRHRYIGASSGRSLSMAMSKMKLASMVFLEAAENLSRNGKLENPIITF